MVLHITVADSQFFANVNALTATGPDTLIVDRDAFLISNIGFGAALIGGPWTVLVNGKIGTNNGLAGGLAIGAPRILRASQLGRMDTYSVNKPPWSVSRRPFLRTWVLSALVDPFGEAVFLGDFADTFNNFKKVGKVIKSGTVLGPITLGGGDDHFNGGAKSETVRDSDGSDTIKFGGGNDLYRAVDPLVPVTADGTDIINGGAGVDTYDLTGVAAVFLINLDTMEHDGLAAQTAIKVFAATDTIIGFENVIGGPGADVIYGSRGANVIQGGDNTDAIYGLAGGDTLSGGDGADTFYYRSLADSGKKASNRDLITDYVIAFRRQDRPLGH